MLRSYLTPVCQGGSHRTEVLRPCPALSQVASTDSDSELSGWRAGHLLGVLLLLLLLFLLLLLLLLFSLRSALSILGAQEWITYKRGGKEISQGPKSRIVDLNKK